MQTITSKYNSAINAPVRRFKAKVEVYANNALAFTYTQDDAIKSIDIERIGSDSKFFGFGVSTKANIKLRDVPREINITTANTLKVYLGIVEGAEVEYFLYPDFYVTEVNRDENTNELSITCYDLMEKFTATTIAELNLEAPYTLGTCITAICNHFGIGASFTAEFDSLLDISYTEGANLEGTENVRDVLTAAAEALQGIYYLSSYNQLNWRRLSPLNPSRVIDKESYIKLDSSTNRRLVSIVSATELGDNVGASLNITGTTQYVRDNPFWELRQDIDALVDNALAAIGGLTINQFECEWRGDLALEPGDVLELTTKDNETVISYFLNDSLSYDGGLSQKTQWNYTDSEGNATNPTSLGEVLKQTYARVDKANKQIDIVASEVGANSDAIGSLSLNTDSILATVRKLETITNDSLESVSKDINTLSQKVETQISAEDVQIAIQSELANGVDKVTTSTGFTFNETGLTVSKTGSEMTTTITEDGMIVYRDTDAVLIADNEGVKAEDLHATTYLIVGVNSRFEDFTSVDGESRTGCFWIGD